MEPIKFEDNIREKLQEREISPSNVAWGKIEKQLNSGTSRKKDRSKWYAIAAGFVGIIIIASYIFKKDIVSFPDSKNIVEEPIQKEGLNSTENNALLVDTDEEKSVIEDTEPLKVKHKDSNPDKNKVAINNESRISSNPNTAVKEDVVVLQIDNSETIKISETATKEDLINLKVEEVVAQVQALQENNQSVTEVDIDALLLKAQKEIYSQRIVTNKRVDATELLHVVESEMETTFRDKVFEALGDGYEKVRTAVVERNN